MEQIWRFVRLFVVAFAGAWAVTGNATRKDAVIGAVVGAAETAYRELRPVASSS